jgi:hypothetical protein
MRWRKVNICRFSSGNWFFSGIFGQIAEAGNKHSTTVHLLQKSVLNMIWLLVPVLDWPIIMIAPGGLLLVVPTYMQFRFQFYGWGYEKKVNNWTWMWEILLQGHILSTGGDALRTLKLILIMFRCKPKTFEVFNFFPWYRCWCWFTQEHYYIMVYFGGCFKVCPLT